MGVRSSHQLSGDGRFHIAVFNSSTVFGLSVVCESIIIVEVVLRGNLGRRGQVRSSLLSLRYHISELLR